MRCLLLMVMNMWKALPAVVGVTAAVLLAGCGTDSRPQAVETEIVTVAAAPTPVSTTAVVAPPPTPVVEKVTDVEGSEPGPCTDVDLAVSHKPIESQGSEYRLVLLFENTSSKRCRLNGYPGADIVNETGPAVHVDRRQQIAAPVLMLEPGDVATADLQASDVHPQTEGPCPHWGSVTVIAPNTFQERPLDVGMPMCSALISSVT
jgi:hypothetical protein